MKIHTLFLFPILLQSLPASADSLARIKATRDFQMCQIDMQQQRAIKGRDLLDRSYQHYKSIHQKTYAMLATSIRIMERDVSRNLVSLLAYEATPDFVLEQMNPKPAFYNLARLMVSLRNETREFLIDLGLDPAHPLMQKPMISLDDIMKASGSLKNAPSGSHEWFLGIPIFLSPSLRAADQLLKGLKNVIIPTEEGFSLHPDVYSSPQVTMERIEKARLKVIENLKTIDLDLKNWTSWGKGDSEDCPEEYQRLKSIPL